MKDGGENNMLSGCYAVPPAAEHWLSRLQTSKLEDHTGVTFIIPPPEPQQRLTSMKLMLRDDGSLPSQTSHCRSPSGTADCGGPHQGTLGAGLEDKRTETVFQ